MWAFARSVHVLHITGANFVVISRGVAQVTVDNPASFGQRERLARALMPRNVAGSRVIQRKVTRHVARWRAELKSFAACRYELVLAGRNGKRHYLS